MAYRSEKNTEGKNDIILYGVENGIAPSPHKGIADIKNANLDSFVGEASVNYARTNQLPVIASGSVSGTSLTPSIAYVYGAKQKLIVGSCIVPSASTITSFTANKPYWVTALNLDNGTAQFVSITDSYGGTAISPGTSGSATIDTFSIHQFIQSASEYRSSDNKYIYYMCDVQGVVWANDPAVYGVFAPTGDVDGTRVTTNPVTGFGVSQGVAFVFSGDSIIMNFTFSLGVHNYSSTTNLGWDAGATTNIPPSDTISSHYAMSVPDQNGSLYYCDGQWVGQVSSIAADTAGAQRFSLMKVSCDGSTSTITVSSYVQGVVPGNGLPVAVVAVPGGSLPTGLTGATTYYIQSYSQTAGTFILGTSAGSGAVTPSSAGSFYVTSFIGDADFPLITSFTKQAFALPYYSIANCLEYVTQGSSLSVVVGTVGRSVYFFSPGSAGIQSVLLLPEATTIRILNVDNTAYIFTGSKGNIYLSNGSVIAGVLSVPDYIANIDGTNQDPPWVWGDVMFLRGRVWFSIQDQTASHTGNGGGVYSFVPTQNLFIGQDQGIRLRLENISSYATYNGRCTVLIPLQDQTTNGPQYFSGWQSAYDAGSPTYGIDYSSSSPYTGGETRIDWDLIPIGTFLQNFTPSNIEYKTSRKLVSGESVQILYRTNLKDTFTPLGTDSTVGNLSFPFTSSIQNAQWLQLRSVQKAVANGSYVPITEIRIRP